MTSKDFRVYHNPYANLAAAIVRSGVHCHDTVFLESDWCDVLRSMCQLDDEMYGRRNLQTQGKSYVSTPHISPEIN